MGMYTELMVGCTLKHETPKELIDTLRWMMADNNGQPEPSNLPGPGSRTRWMFRSGGSYYFGAPSPVPTILEFDDISKCYRFHCRFNIKNYENEIELFLEWLKPWVEQGSGGREMWAMKTYEEDDEPTLYYLKEKGELD